eukprot:GILI01030605.1.p1 GENE.GILI01030605.1~~GILI01030605.1.p1  ORF type:complete len:183 (+),score=11.47 GILI01030605.1:97-645(+)
MAFKPRFPSLQLFVLFWQAVSFILTVMTWWWFFKKNRTLFGDSWVDGHFVIQFIGGVSMFVISPSMYWPYMYGTQMPPSRRRDLMALFIVATFIMHDFPCWIIEFSLAWQYGVIDVLQGISLTVLSVCTFWGFLTTWLYYSWTMARISQKHFGATMRDLHPTDGRHFTMATKRARSGPPERI